PSVIFLIYGFLTETSIGKLFLAGVLPVILLTVMFVFTIAIVTWHNPKLAPTVQERASFPDRLKALREVWAVAALFSSSSAACMAACSRPPRPPASAPSAR